MKDTRKGTYKDLTVIDKLKLDLANLQDTIATEKDITGYHLLVIKEDGNHVANYHNADNYIYLLGMLDIFLIDIKTDIAKSFKSIDYVDDSELDSKLGKDLDSRLNKDIDNEC